MSIIPQWENNDKTIIMIQFSDEWTWNEFVPVRKTILDMIESVSHCVDYIVDFQDVDDIPNGALAIGRSIHKSCPYNHGTIVIVGFSAMLRILYQSLILVYPASKDDFVLVTTLSDAYLTIADIQDNRNKN